MKILFIILLCAMLTACGSAAETGTGELLAVAESTAETSAAPEATAAPAETVSVTAEEKAEIQALLTEAGKFSYDYLDFKEIIKHINPDEYIYKIKKNESQEYTKKWCLVDSGEVTSMKELTNKMNAIFTKDVQLTFDWLMDCLIEQDGKLYLLDEVGGDGSLLGTDYAYIVSAEEPDEDTIILNMTAFGAGENWDLDHDLTEDFTIRLKRTEDGLRIDSFDPGVRQYIEWAYTPEMDMI